MLRTIFNITKHCLVLSSILLLGNSNIAFGADNSALTSLTDYKFCSDERAACSFKGTRVVRYGANGRYTYKVVTDGVDCNNSTFGDPLHGTVKACYYSRKVDSSSVKYTHCANEREKCDFSGKRVIRYGAKGTYTYKVATDGVSCANNIFGDPLRGTAKECSYSTDVTSRTLAHPGALNTEEEFALMREKIAAEAEPWLTGWNGLKGDTRSVLGRTPRPLSNLVRGGSDSNFGRIIRELQYMYAAALVWKVTGESAYAEQAISYLNDWSYTLTSLTGNSDVALAAGLYGYQFAITGEIMKTYDGWAAKDQQQLTDMLLNHFYPISTSFLKGHNGTCYSHYWANWDLANIAGIMATGIFTDRVDLYEEALDYVLNGRGNGALRKLMYYRHAGNMGQYQESGRDQGHATLGVSLYGVIAKMAWNQGDDLFAHNNYQMLATSEYIARYNVDTDQTVPFIPYDNCSAAYETQYEIEDHARGLLRPSWAMIYNHYQNVLGIAAPWSEKAAEKVSPEVPGNGDEPGWGTLTEAQEEAASGGAPRGLTAILYDGYAELSWWGAYGAENYNVKRSSYANGPYEVIAEIEASELLTYTDKTIEKGQRYYYQVTALTSGYESDSSNTASIKAGDLLLHRSFDEGTAEGVIGNAVALDGEDDYIQLQDGLLEGIGDFTVTGWIYQESRNKWGRFFDFGINNSEYFHFTPYMDDTYTSCFITTRDGYATKHKICANALPEKEWSHVAITVSGHDLVLYIDGKQFNTTQVKWNPYQMQLDDTARYFLGRSQNEGEGVDRLHGRIDDFRVYSGALTASEIASLATPPN
jgi:hypothetical protein